jgi:hypothetical protein
VQGVLSMTEFRNGLKDQLHLHFSHRELVALSRFLDADHSGFIDVHEFEHLMAVRTIMMMTMMMMRMMMMIVMMTRKRRKSMTKLSITRTRRKRGRRRLSYHDMLDDDCCFA